MALLIPSPLARAWRLILVSLFLGAASIGHAQATEEAVKAAFIPKFARYVEWPGLPPRAPWTLCIIGQDPFGPNIDRAAASETVDGRSIQVRRLGAPTEAQSCHLAFVRGSNHAQTAQWLTALRARPILTITDQRAGPHRGIVHFTISGGRVRFFIDDAAAARQRLTISSRLLALALGVRQRR